ncbi:MAG: hypothetical protein IJF78_12740 [Clostridia bacterium]|nr:hypothetical protein [Clostridia bacterium]
MLSALKNFGVTFLISAALFGIIAYFATGFVTSTVSSILDEEDSELDSIIQNEPSGEETGTDNPGTPGTEEVTPEGESFNFLIITSDYRPDLYNDYQPTLDTMYNHNWYNTPPSETMGSLSTEYREDSAASIVLVRVDKERRQFLYTYFSPETRVYTSTGYHTLSDVYTLYGKDAVAEHIHALTGMRVKYTSLINAYNFDELISVLGSVTAAPAKDIYRDGTGAYTMQYETAVKMTGPNGAGGIASWTERYPNTWVMGTGENELDGEEMYTILSVEERSGAEMEAKKKIVIDLLQKYLTAIASMDEENMKYNMAKLVNREADWVNLKKPGEEESAADTDAPAEDSAGNDLPFDTTPVDPSESEGTLPDVPSETDEYGNPIPAETDEYGNPIPAETDEYGNPVPEETLAPWLTEPFEPDNPIVETNYTMNDFDEVFQLLAAVTEFEAVILDYPGEFKPASEDEEACFAGDLEEALELFMPYRKNAE